MKLRSWLGGCLALAGLLSVTALAQGQAVDLKWKGFSETGDKGKFYQTITTKTTQEMEVKQQATMKVKQVQEQIFYVEWTPVEKTKDDDWKIKQKIIGIKMDIDIGGNKINFDSTDEKAAKNPLSEFFNTIKTAEFELVVGKDLTVKSVSNRDEFIKKLASTNASLKPLLDAILTDDALKQMFQQAFDVLPPSGKSAIEPKTDKAAAKNDTWTQRRTLKLGPVGTYVSDVTYTYKGSDAKAGKDAYTIDVRTKLTYTAPSDDEQKKGGLPFRIKSAKLESEDQSSTGTITYNLGKGRIEKSDLNMKVSGPVTIEIGGTETVVTLTQTQRSTLETSDTPPAFHKTEKK